MLVKNSLNEGLLYEKWENILDELYNTFYKLANNYWNDTSSDLIYEFVLTEIYESFNDLKKELSSLDSKDEKYDHSDDFAQLTNFHYENNDINSIYYIEDWDENEITEFFNEKVNDIKNSQEDSLKHLWKNVILGHVTEEIEREHTELKKDLYNRQNSAEETQAEIINNFGHEVLDALNSELSEEKKIEILADAMWKEDDVNETTQFKRGLEPRKAMSIGKYGPGWEELLKRAKADVRNFSYYIHTDELEKKIESAEKEIKRQSDYDNNAKDLRADFSRALTLAKTEFEKFMLNNTDLFDDLNI